MREGDILVRDGAAAREVRIAALMSALLVELGYAAEGELARTPTRAAAFWATWHTRDACPEMVLFDGPNATTIEVGPIPFVSICRHHLLPFYGTVTIKYGARHKVIGLSKLPRLVTWCARRLTKQEDMTDMIAEVLGAHAPGGVEVVSEAEHLCMSMRGVHIPGTKTRCVATRAAR